MSERDDDRPPKPTTGEWKWNSLKRRWVELIPFEQSFGAQLSRATKIDWENTVALGKKRTKRVR